jgi:hypothetical protein
MPTGDAPRSSALVSALHRWVDPVLAEAGFEWNDSGEVADDGRLVSALYEADPVDFVQRYPQTRLRDGYGDQWPPPCVDLWLTFDWKAGRAELDIEGFEPDDRARGHDTVTHRVSGLSGNADEDAQLIAAALARILGVAGRR